VQLLDGVGAGIFGALTPLVLADLMRGTGRYNVSQGAVATMQGIGASLSNTVAGVIVVSAGYSIAFLTLAAIALVAFVVFLLAMPETGESGKKDPNEAAPYGSPARAAMPAISAAAAYTVTRNRRSLILTPLATQDHPSRVAYADRPRSEATRPVSSNAGRLVI
jgi:MFS family permease